jgi:hypothetical protein
MKPIAFLPNGLMLALVLASIGVIALGTAAVQARDDGRYANSPWDTKDGHYRVRLDGEWVVVPTDAVITEPNRAGRTMVWPYYVQGHPVIRCFLPGTMT